MLDAARRRAAAVRARASSCDAGRVVGTCRVLSRRDRVPPCALDSCRPTACRAGRAGRRGGARAATARRNGRACERAWRATSRTSHASMSSRPTPCSSTACASFSVQPRTRRRRRPPPATAHRILDDAPRGFGAKAHSAAAARASPAARRRSARSSARAARIRSRSCAMRTVTGRARRFACACTHLLIGTPPHGRARRTYFRPPKRCGLAHLVLQSLSVGQDPVGRRRRRGRAVHHRGRARRPRAASRSGASLFDAARRSPLNRPRSVATASNSTRSAALARGGAGAAHDCARARTSSLALACAHDGFSGDLRRSAARVVALRRVLWRNQHAFVDLRVTRHRKRTSPAASSCRRRKSSSRCTRRSCTGLGGSLPRSCGTRRRAAFFSSRRRRFEQPRHVPELRRAKSRLCALSPAVIRDAVDHPPTRLRHPPLALENADEGFDYT